MGLSQATGHSIRTENGRRRRDFASEARPMTDALAGAVIGVAAGIGARRSWTVASGSWARLKTRKGQQLPGTIAQLAKAWRTPPE